MTELVKCSTSEIRSFRLGSTSQARIVMISLCYFFSQMDKAPNAEIRKLVSEN